MVFLQITIIILIIIAIFGIFKPAKSVKVNKKSANIVVLDSCALIDGRVIELAKLGFLPNRIIVPEFVVKELQLLADGRDAHKRERARYGLQVVQEVQNINNVSSEIDRFDPDKKTVDEKLVELAKKHGADLYTTDFNLNQVASIEGVKVLNVNELAHALRPVVLPGELVDIKIKQSGTNKDQGVGYLDDGTMIVIDNAVRDIGKTIKVKIEKSHQTVAGKMLFATKQKPSNYKTFNKPRNK